MKQLIVNADDFGLTRLVSQGILDAHNHGIVTSASLLANGGAFEEATAMAARAPALSIGVHLALTQGTPVSPPSEVSTLVDPRGRFCGTAGEFLKKVVTRRIDLREVEIELRRQITRVLRAGITATHLDGHKHVHVLPGISEIVTRLAQEFGIPNVRCPAEELSLADLWQGIGNLQAGALKQYLAGSAISGLARGLRLRLMRARLNCPSHFYGLIYTGFLDEETLGRILRSLREGVSELMCHPGYADSVLAKTGTRLLAQREIEARAITSSRTKALVSSEGIQLLSYAELGHSEKGTDFQNAEVKTNADCVRAV